MLLLSEEPAKAEEPKKEAAKAEAKEETPKDDKEAAAVEAKETKKAEEKAVSAEKKKAAKEEKAIKEIEEEEAHAKAEHHEEARKRTAQEAVTHWAEEGKKWIGKQTADEAKAFKDYNDRASEKFHQGRPYNSALIGVGVKEKLQTQTGSAIKLNAGLAMKNSTYSQEPAIMSRIDQAKKLMALAQKAEDEDK